MSQPPTWSFSAQIEHFDVDAAWHFLAIPAEHVDAVREAGDGRYVITVNDAVTWHCGLLPTGDGRWFVAVSKVKIKAPQATFGGWFTWIWPWTRANTACRSPRICRTCSTTTLNFYETI